MVRHKYREKKFRPSPINVSEYEEEKVQQFLRTFFSFFSVANLLAFLLHDALQSPRPTDRPLMHFSFFLHFLNDTTCDGDEFLHKSLSESSVIRAHTGNSRYAQTSQLDRPTEKQKNHSTRVCINCILGRSVGRSVEVDCRAKKDSHTRKKMKKKEEKKDAE